jgi:hypothetical protein
VNSQTVHHLILAAHVLGVVILSGSVLGGMLTDRALWARFAIDPKAGGAFGPLLMNFGRLAGVGSAVMVLSGLSLLAHSQWVYWGAPWLSVKLVLFVLMALNGMIIGASTGKKLGALFGAAAAGAPLDQAAVMQVRTRRKWFHISETTMFVVTVLMAILKIS